MDIQLCYNKQVEIYLSKYICKSGDHITVKMVRQNTKEHFQARKVGMIDVIYDLISYHKHQNSIGVLYIDTTMPNGDFRRQLKSSDLL